MAKFYIRTLIFLIINFAALGVGGFYTGTGVSSEWYANLAKAPWTPPGWVFGTAWTTIMIALAIFMGQCTKKILPFNFKNKIVIWYWVQIVLNIVWNPIFFYYHEATFGVITIALLTIVVFSMFFLSKNKTSVGYRLLLLPYMIWLLIATSLNLYVVVMN